MTAFSSARLTKEKRGEGGERGEETMVDDNDRLFEAIITRQLKDAAFPFREHIRGIEVAKS